MRVLHFYRTYLPETHGGAEEAIRQICLSTGNHGVQNRVLSLARVDRVTEIDLDEARVIQVPLQLEPASCSIGMKAFEEYRKHAQWADVIHIHYPWPFADLVHVLSRVQKPALVTYHSDIIRQNLLEKIYSPLRAVFFRSVDRFIATSPDYMASSKLLQRLADRTDVIPLGLDPNSYKPASIDAQDEVQRQFGSGFFLFVGVLRYYKGLRYLVDAAAETGLPVIIAGHGPEQETLVTQARRKGADNVRFVGFVSNDMKQALLEKAKAIVFPSCERSEAFGVTLLEGQMHGLPLITCDIGTGTSYVNRHGETGVVIPACDSRALANAMREIENNPDQAHRMGQAGRERFQRLFSGEQVGERYLNVYRQLLGQTTTTPQRKDR